MKIALVLVSTLWLGVGPARGELIAEWNFNSAISDGSTATGSTNPSFGSGTASLIGGTSATFATGSAADTAPDNSGWNLSTFPAQGTSNKTAGAQFNVGTVGFTDIQVIWQHRVSGSASKYSRLQYSKDGVNFSDAVGAASARVVSSSSAYSEAQTNLLGGLAELGNNPKFAFRIVSEFELTATGHGTNGYVTTYGTNAYSRAGTVRLDMVRICGNKLPGANTPPVITSLQNQTLRVGQSSGPLPFQVWDGEEAAAGLRLNAGSGSPGVIGPAQLIFGGSGTNRTVTVLAGTTPGTAAVTITVTDSGGKSAMMSFTATVLPLNTAPTITGLEPVRVLAGRPSPALQFNVSDLETAPKDLSVSGWSANPALLPNDSGHLFFGGQGSNRTVTLVPATGQCGIAPITLTVSDGPNIATTAFPVIVVPASDVLLFEPFSYGNGSLVSNSAALWKHRSGSYPGECLVTNGQLQISGAQTEDVGVDLPGGPFGKGSNALLYASFRMKWLTLPADSAGYFAHFVGGSSLRARVYAKASSSLPGFYQLLVANGSVTNTLIPYNLTTNTSYSVVIRYDIDRARTTLWLNPKAEGDPGATAGDGQTPISIGGFGFRQDGDIGGSVLLDDLRLGQTFAAVVPGAALPSPGLAIRRNAGGVVLSWTGTGFTLQCAPKPEGVYTNIGVAVSPYTNSAGARAGFFRLFK